MQEHLLPTLQGANASRSNTLLVDAHTLTLNREGKLSPEQLQRFGKGISLVNWFLSPIFPSLFIIVFVGGLIAPAFSTWLASNPSLLLGFYGLLVGGFLLGLALMPMISKNTPSRSHFKMAGAGAVLLCFGAWLLCSLFLLLIFAFTVNWVGLLIAWSLFYALLVWSMTDDFFKGRAFQAASHEAVVTHIGEVAWDRRKGKQRVRIDGRGYHAISPLPEPGLYLFYCLPSVAYVVSATPLSEADLPPLPVSSTVARALDYFSPLESANDRALRRILLASLARSLKFSEADLYANTRGYLSWWQFTRRTLSQLFHALGRVAPVFPIAAATGMLGIMLLQNQFIFSLFTSLQDHLNITDSNGEVLLFFTIFIFPPAVLFLLYQLKVGISRIPRVLNWRVIVIDGKVTSNKGAAPPHSLYKEAEGIRLATKQQAFGVPSGAGSAFSPSIPYRFYTHASTSDIVSALPLEWDKEQDLSAQASPTAE